MALSIVDAGLPGKARESLSYYFDLVEFSTKDIVYESISGHPAILYEAVSFDKISVKQGCTRCNLLPLKSNSFITSDKGIYKILSSIGFNVLYVNPGGILLPGFKHGFFGGTCGVYENTVFISGDLNHFREGPPARNFLHALKYDIIELYNGPLFDCGSILIIS